jgi:hypothetical protein
MSVIGGDRPLASTATQEHSSVSAPAVSRWGPILAARITAVTVGLLLPLLVLEVALRMFGPFLPGNYDTGALVKRHPTLGHFHQPNSRTWLKTPRFTTQLDYNPMGLRDPRQSYDKPPGTFRILMLGDSFIEASQVQATETAATQLERILGSMLSRPVEVINAGVFGYGSAQEYLLLDQEGPKYQPDLVLLFFCHCNDVPNNNYRLELIDGDLNRALKPYFDLDDDGGPLRLILPPPPSQRTSVRERLRDSSLLYNVVETGVVYKFELPNPEEAFNGVDGLVDPLRGKYDYRQTGEWDRGWRITDQVIEMLRNRSTALGAPLAIVGIPGWRMLDRPYWRRDNNKRLVDSGRGGPDAPIRMLEGIARRLQIPHLDLSLAFQPRVDADGLDHYHIEDDGHWTVAGNRLTAETVATFLAEQELLPR